MQINIIKLKQQAEELIAKGEKQIAMGRKLLEAVELFENDKIGSQKAPIIHRTIDRSHISQKDTVYRILEEANKPLSRHDVLAKLAENGCSISLPSLSAIMSRMKEAGTIKAKSRGNWIIITNESKT